MIKARRLLLFPLLLSCASSLRAEMTAAWTLPSPVTGAPAPPFSENAKKLDHAPAESAFFQPGDEIWDLSQSIRWQDLISKPDDPKAPVNPTPKWTGSWVVWDARSNLVIARGMRNELASVERVLHLDARPVNVITTFERVDRSTHASRSLTVSGDLGKAATMTSDGWEVAVTDTRNHLASGITVAFKSHWPAGEPGSQWEMETALLLHDGEKTLIAREEEWELWGTTHPESPDGVPRGKWRLIERDGKIEPWPMTGGIPVRETLENGQTLFWIPAFDIDFDGQLKSVPDDGTPFTEVPADLRSRLRADFRDCSASWRGEDDNRLFAAYDPLANLCIALQKTPGYSDRLSDVFSERNQTIEVNEAAGFWYLAHPPIKPPMAYENFIAKRNGDREEISFRPYFGMYAGSGMIHVDDRVDAVAGGKAIARFQLGSGLIWNRPSKVASFQLEGGPEIPVMVTVGAVDMFK